MADRNNTAHFVAPGEGRVFEVLGDRYIFYLESDETGGSHSLIELISPPGGGPPLHVHENEDETFFILDGDFELWCGDATFKAGAGGVIFLPRRVPHTFRVVGQGPGRAIVMVTPGGFERFLRAAHEASSEGPLSVEKVAALAAPFGVSLVNPSID